MLILSFCITQYSLETPALSDKAEIRESELCSAGGEYCSRLRKKSFVFILTEVLARFLFYFHLMKMPTVCPPPPKPVQSPFCSLFLSGHTEINMSWWLIARDKKLLSRTVMHDGMDVHNLPPTHTSPVTSESKEPRNLM